jgi:hypothetical protein
MRRERCGPHRDAGHRAVDSTDDREPTRVRRRLGASSLGGNGALRHGRDNRAQHRVERQVVAGRGEECARVLGKLNGVGAWSGSDSHGGTVGGSTPVRYRIPGLTAVVGRAPDFASSQPASGTPAEAGTALVGWLSSAT